MHIRAHIVVAAVPSSTTAPTSPLDHLLHTLHSHATQMVEYARANEPWTELNPYTERRMTKRENLREMRQRPVVGSRASIVVGITGGVLVILIGSRLLHKVWAAAWTHARALWS